MRNIAMPQYLYHGTTFKALPLFQQKLLAPQFWNPKRDFGAGFYTTISFTQAKRWASHVAYDEEIPCVLKLELLKLPRLKRVRIFLSPSLEWSAYIFRHRSQTTRTEDPCGLRHPQLLVGPCADGDTGNIVREAIQYKKSIVWFHETILRSKKGKPLDPEQLDSQIVFSDPALEPYLRLNGSYSWTKGVWRYAEIQGLPQSGPI